MKLGGTVGRGSRVGWNRWVEAVGGAESGGTGGWRPSAEPSRVEPVGGGAEPGGAEPGGEPVGGGAESGGAEPGGEPVGGGAESGGTGGWRPSAEPSRVEEPSRAEPVGGGAESGGTGGWRPSAEPSRAEPVGGGDEPGGTGGWRPSAEPSPGGRRRWVPERRGRVHAKQRGFSRYFRAIPPPWRLSCIRGAGFSANP